VSVVVLAAGIPVVVTALLGEAPYRQIALAFPGLDVGIPTSLFLVMANIGAMVSVGALVHLMFLRDAPRARAAFVPEGFEVRLLRLASGVWATGAAGLVVFEMLDANGAPLSRLSIPGAVAFLFEASTAPASWAISFVAAMVVFFAAFFAGRWTGLLIPLWASAVGVLAPVVTGQVLVEPDHDFGGDAAVFQTLAVFSCFGSVAVMALRALSGRQVARETVRRVLVLCAVGLPVIWAADVVLAVFKLAGSDPTASLTGWLILAGMMFLLVLSGSIVRIWWSARRSDAAQITSAQITSAQITSAQITSALTIGVIAICGWIGVTAAMTRQPPPQYFVPTSITQVFMGFDVPDAPSVAVLFGQWRPNLLFLVIALAAVAVYLVAVRTLHRRGDRWPLGRTISWLLGWGVVVFVTSSGFGRYSAPDFGIHMIVHMSLNMLDPGLLVLGGVVTLLLRATRTDARKPAGVHDWLTWVLKWPVLRFIYNPLVVFIVFVGSYYGLYFTPLFGELMRFHWGHQLMNLHFLIVGYLYYGLIIGVDRPPRPLPQIGKLGYVLAAMPFHAFFGIVLMTSTQIVAEKFYSYLNLPWADLQAQQYFAGGVAWAGGEIPLLIVIIILVIQWGREDAREARRADRHFDTGRSEEYDDYNRMLQQLTQRNATQPAAPPTPQQENAHDR
jgi:putative copper resistance protein D